MRRSRNRNRPDSLPKQSSNKKYIFKTSVSQQYGGFSILFFNPPLTEFSVPSGVILLIAI